MMIHLRLSTGTFYRPLIRNGLFDPVFFLLLGQIETKDEQFPLYDKLVIDQFRIQLPVDNVCP